MTILDALQWAGSLFVVAGYFALGRASITWGMGLTLPGCLCFVVWAWMTDADGVLFLNAVVLAATIQAIYHILRKSRTKN